MESAFLDNPAGTGAYCHAPSLLSTRAGTDLAIWYAYEDQEHVGATLVLARRASGSTEWRARAFSAAGYQEAGRYSAGNPVLFEDASGAVGLLFVVLRGCYWEGAELQGCYSHDDGLSWSAPRSQWDTPGLMVRHPPVSLPGGSMLLPAYEEGGRQAVVLRSSSGVTWTELYRFKDPPLLQPALISDGAGRLSLFFRPWEDPRRIWRSHSTDEGRNWSTPMRTPLPCPLSGIGAFALTDRIGLVYNHTEAHERRPLSLAVSRDGGVTWTPPWHFDPSSHEVSYPQFHARTDGGVHGVYSYNRRVIRYVQFDRDDLP